jgi:cytochrome c oxidase subunit II
MGKGSHLWMDAIEPKASLVPGWSRATLVLLVGLLASVASAGLASAHGSGSAHPDDWKRLLNIVLVMAAIVATVVYSAITIALWRYGENSTYKRKEPKVHDRKLETIWTIIPAIMVILIVIFSVQVMTETLEAPEDSIHIQAIGRQFQWEFVYPDNTSSINEVWVEEGHPVVFDITSEDVLHSFFLPSFYLKVDAFPKRSDEGYFVAEPAGTYDIFCAEFCGQAHHSMRAELHIFERGLSDKPYGPPPGQGPSPPEVDHRNVTLELSEEGGPTAERPWSITPSIIQVPHWAEVSLKVWNNGSQPFDLVLNPPYSRTIEVIPPGEFRYMNFTAELPSAGTSVYSSGNDSEGVFHRDKGLEATFVVVGDTSSEGPHAEEEGDSLLLTIIIAASIIVLAVLILAAFKHPPDEPQDAHPEPETVDEEDGSEERTEDGGDGG